MKWVEIPAHRVLEVERQELTSDFDIYEPEAFVRIVAEFRRFANVIENVASLIVRDHVRTLGESMDKFPQKRLPELLESLSNEISHNKLKADFRERFASVNPG